MTQLSMILLYLIAMCAAHFQLVLPANRGYDDLLEVISPCGGFPLSKREAIPLKAGIKLIAAHSHASVNYAISFNNDPTSQADFQNITTGTVTKLGNFTVAYDFTKFEQARDGSNATIQVIFISVDGELHQCADVYFDLTLPASTEFVSVNGSASASFEFGLIVYLLSFTALIIACGFYCSAKSFSLLKRQLRIFPYWSFSFVAILIAFLVLQGVLVGWQLDISNDAQFNRFAHMGLWCIAVGPLFALRRLVNGFGFIHQRAMEVHKLFTVVGILLSLIHGILYLIEWIRADLLYYEFFKVTPNRNIYGLIAALLGLLTLILGLFVKRVAYRVFYWAHLLSYPLICVMLYIHTSGYVLYYLLPGLVAFVCELTIRFVKRTKVTVTEILPVAQDLTRFTIAFDKLKRPRPGQWYTFYSNGSWHPLSFIEMDQSSRTAKFAINHGNLSRSLKLNNALYIEGPFGNSFNFGQFKNYLLVAGGLGITPILAILKNLQSDVDLKVDLIWIVKKKVILDSFKDDIIEAVKNNVHIRVYITEDVPEDTNEISIHFQKPNLCSVIEDVQFIKSKQKGALIVCGPTLLTLDLVNIFSVKAYKHLAVYVETFE